MLFAWQTTGGELDRDHVGAEQRPPLAFVVGRLSSNPRDCA